MENPVNTQENKNSASKFQMNPARAINPSYHTLFTLDSKVPLNTTKAILRKIAGIHWGRASLPPMESQT